MRGLGRHLELRHLSIKQQAEKLEREKAAFSVKGIDKHRRVEDGCTVVQPFSLSESAGKVSSAVTELLEQEMNECTFIPVTSHVLRREVIGKQARAVF